jgi:hypothetical protein
VRPWLKLAGNVRLRLVICLLGLCAGAEASPPCVRTLLWPLEPYLRYEVTDQDGRIIRGKLEILGNGLWFVPVRQEPVCIASAGNPAQLVEYVALVGQSFVIKLAQDTAD